MHVAWCTPIEAGHKNMHVLEGKDGIFLHQHFSVEPILVVMTAAAMFQNASVSSNDPLATRKIFGHIDLKTAHQAQFKSRRSIGVRPILEYDLCGRKYCKPALLVAFTVLFFIFVYCKCRKSPAGHKPLLENSTP